jgi:hypothetical protein
MAGWPGPQSPNNTGSTNYKKLTAVCGITPQTGCLYDIYKGESDTMLLDVVVMPDIIVVLNDVVVLIIFASQH